EDESVTVGVAARQHDFQEVALGDFAITDGAQGWRAVDIAHRNRDGFTVAFDRLAIVRYREGHFVAARVAKDGVPRAGQRLHAEGVTSRQAIYRVGQRVAAGVARGHVEGQRLALVHRTVSDRRKLGHAVHIAHGDRDALGVALGRFAAV